MKFKTKIFLLIFLLIFLIIFKGKITSSFLNLNYSNPLGKYNSSIYCEQNLSKKYLPDIKKDISKEDWNKIFEEFRLGLISKDEAIERLRSVKTPWLQ